MQQVKLPYGKDHQYAEIPDHILVEVIDPESQQVIEPAEKLIKEAFDQPVGTERLEELAKPEDKIVIIVNDHTRPGPNRQIVDELLRRLKVAGLEDDNIMFVVATGSHRATTEAEIDEIIGETVRKRFNVHVHDCQDEKNLVYLGDSSQGMPLFVNRYVVESSFVITTGLIAPHHSAGFSGGRKSVVPGVAGLKTLKIHHSLPIRPFEPAMGFIYGNPFHEASLEAAKMLNVKFMINAVQDPHKKNIAFVAGEIEKAHNKGVEICRKACEVEISELADVVISSPGGYPRDINLYQAQKALSVAEPLGKPNGVYILMVEGVDGIGEGVFKEWMADANTPEEVVERFKTEGYNVGSNKAFMYARALTKGRVIIVSDHLNQKDLTDMMLEWAPDLQTAIDKVLLEATVNKVIVLPRAVNIIPKLTLGS